MITTTITSTRTSPPVRGASRISIHSTITDKLIHVPAPPAIIGNRITTPSVEDGLASSPPLFLLCACNAMHGQKVGRGQGLETDRTCHGIMNKHKHYSTLHCHLFEPEDDSVGRLAAPGDSEGLIEGLVFVDGVHYISISHREVVGASSILQMMCLSFQ